jgi:glycosyltransferase involved in cell wall biosynthesis
MIFIVYSETTESMIEKVLGRSEYSYYFVLKEFRPVLERLGMVVTVTDPPREVDKIYHAARQIGQDCVFLSFTPPHLTVLGLDCPTIPVFAWEFDTIPTETWFCEREQDWRYDLDRLGRAITHSRHAVSVVKKEMGDDFPIVSIPAPVFDRFDALYDPALADPVLPLTHLSLNGTVIDSRNVDLSIYRPALWFNPSYPAEPQTAEDPAARTDVRLDGVVYSSIFNPRDGRKNWDEMLGAFCQSFRDVDDATLILKFTNRDCALMLARALAHMYMHTPVKCRVVLIDGFLDKEDYERLIMASTYTVIASRGEGQCLPLMESMAAGKPAVAPCHSGMSDYLNSDNAFIVGSSREPTSWPHDPRYAYRTYRHRIDMASLVAAFRESYRVAKEEPARYAAMSARAHRDMEQHCSAAAAATRLLDIVSTPARPARCDPSYGYISPRPDAPWIEAGAE